MSRGGIRQTHGGAGNWQVRGHTLIARGQLIGGFSSEKTALGKGLANGISIPLNMVSAYLPLVT